MNATSATRSGSSHRESRNTSRGTAAWNGGVARPRRANRASRILLLTLVACSDLAGVREMAFVVVVAEDHRAQTSGDRRLPPSHDELLTELTFGLLPTPVASARPIGFRPGLRNHAFEAHPTGGREEVRPRHQSRGQRIVAARVASRRGDLEAAPFAARREAREEILTVEVDDVEDEVGEVRATW